MRFLLDALTHLRRRPVITESIDVTDRTSPPYPAFTSYYAPTTSSRAPWAPLPFIARIDNADHSGHYNSTVLVVALQLDGSAVVVGIGGRVWLADIVDLVATDSGGGWPSGFAEQEQWEGS